MWVPSLGQEDPLEEEMAAHSSILAWRISWTEEPGGLQSTGSQSRTRLKQLNRHTHRKCLKDIIALSPLVNVSRASSLSTDMNNNSNITLYTLL